MIIQNIEILDAGAEGMAIGRADDKVVFIPFAVPGDMVDVRIVRKKKKFLEGRIVKIHHRSDQRIEPHCRHFGLCGGCRWQNMHYDSQLHYKQKQVTESLIRIGKLHDPLILPIIPSPETRFYRNKLDFTFSVHRWLSDEDKSGDPAEKDTRAVGFHIPQFFDKVVDVEYCYHQADPSNAIRNEAKRYALEQEIPFYDVRTWQGQLRNLIIRTTTTGETMVILVFRTESPENERMLAHLATTFPEITSLFCVINPKKNDSLYDLEFRLFKGLPYITEVMEPFLAGRDPVAFRIGPLSFFQTNPRQAARLYRVAAEFAGFSGHEHVYDLYTGTGTIANYIAHYVSRVTGLESVSAAITDARINAQINGITNTTFFAGEAEKLLTPGFLLSEGTPDLVITDPPRNGMHEKVIRTLLDIRPARIVYVSCNPATQARDIALMSHAYTVTKNQPVDMFPHTQHVENVALLELLT